MGRRRVRRRGMAVAEGGLGRRALDALQLLRTGIDNLESLIFRAFAYMAGMAMPEVGR